MKIAIIGAGFAGSYLYNRLRSNLHDVTIFEKSRGCGGRLSTKYIDSHFCEHGTPYFSTKEPDFIYFCNKLVKKGILSKLNNTYIPNKGMNNLCKTLINNDDLKRNTKIVTCYKSNNKWLLKDENKNSYEDFDMLILTIPAKQVLQLNIELNENIQSKLEQVEYSSVASLILHHNKEFKIDDSILNSQFFKKVINNSSKYEYKNFYSYVFHGNEDFSSSNNHKNKEQLGEELFKYIEYFQKKPLSKDIKKIPHLWKYAFVKKGIENIPYYFDKSSNLAICSDYFKTANLEGSFLSSKAFFDEFSKLN